MSKATRIMLIIAALAIIPLEGISTAKKITQKKKPDSTNIPVPEKKEIVKKESERSIKITNGIEQEMLGVRYFGKTHSPSKFCLSVDGKKLEPTEHTEIKLTGDQLTVQYEYEFANGLYTGKKDVSFTVKPDAKELNINFSWDDNYRIQIDNAQAKSIKKAKI